jgi:hypothetical protein
MSKKIPTDYEDCRNELPKAVEAMKAALSKSDWSISACEPLNWKVGIPNSDIPGVYLIFDGGGALIYVGKAERPMGAEVWSKFKRGQSDEDLLWIEGPLEQAQPRSIATIPIPEEVCYLAPALEGLLIGTLDPQLNVLKKEK